MSTGYDSGRTFFQGAKHADEKSTNCNFETQITETTYDLDSDWRNVPMIIFERSFVHKPFLNWKQSHLQVQPFQ